MTTPRRYPPEKLVGYDPAWAGRYAYLAGLLAPELGPGWEI